MSNSVHDDDPGVQFRVALLQQEKKWKEAVARLSQPDLTSLLDSYSIAGLLPDPADCDQRARKIVYGEELETLNTSIQCSENSASTIGEPSISSSSSWEKESTRRAAIERARQTRGHCTKKHLADLIGVKYTALSSWERNRGIQLAKGRSKKVERIEDFLKSPLCKSDE